HGDRIDLGLGRAPGTDQLTAQLLARTSAEPQAFIAAVEQMRDWSREEGAGSLPITAEVARGTEVPMWILGSTANGARLAAQDRKSTRLNSSHVSISYAVFCLRKKLSHTLPSCD